MPFVECVDTQMLSIPPEPQTFSITNEDIPARALRNVGKKNDLSLFFSLLLIENTPFFTP